MVTSTLAPNDAVLLVSHGTVTDLNDLPAFLRNIRRGRAAPPELEAEMQRRYEAIGGSPLLAWTNKQAAALETRLRVPVRIGMRLWRPTIEEGLAELAGLGAIRIVVLPLAPYSVHVYAAAAESAASRLAEAPEVVNVQAWGCEPALIAAHADRIRPFVTGPAADDTRLVITAHSLPRTVIDSGDPYQAEFEASARALAGALGVAATIAYQSQGADGGDWLGPDLVTAMEEARLEGKRRIVVAPVGFLSDHVETLYDLDIEARAQASALGLAFDRVPALNDDPGLISAMANVATNAVSERSA